MRRAARRDDNEKSIVAALIGVGASVLQMDKIDLIVGFRGANYLLEIKMHKGKLTPFQKKLRENWHGQYAICRTIDQALLAIGAISE